MKKVRVALGRNSYTVYIGLGLLEQVGSRLKELGFSDRLVIITDQLVKKLHGAALKRHLTGDGFTVNILDVPEGEEQKSLETAARLYGELTDLYAERTTPVLALGGGVIGDLAGFVAATYLRGVPLVQIPTTLLAQVDSSIGGKVAVDHGQMKNKIGAFYQPRLVISDIATLKTLTPGDLSDGLAEAIKHGVIWDRDYFTYIEGNLDRIKPCDDSALETLVSGSARIKAAVVARDERDLGLRNILNYGHTIGHAIESVSDFRVGHGQAVAIGMLAAARISSRMGIFDTGELIRLKGVIQKAGLLTEAPPLDVSRLLEFMKHDKKIIRGRVRFVLPRTIGEVFISDEVTPSMIKEVLVEQNE
jgi:3-dehydroquinate synthase